MFVAIRIVLWALLAAPLSVLLAGRFHDLRLPLPRFVGSALGWAIAGLILAWALPIFGQHLGLPWAFAHP
jgi:uncharacterized membrane protein YccC